MIEAAVGAPVRQHDDGSWPAMHDLDIIRPDGVTGVVEVTAAADPAAIEQWNLMNGGGRWIVDTIRGGWAVHTRIGSSWRRLKVELPLLLQQLEAHGISLLNVDERPRGDLQMAAAALGVARAWQSGTDFPGSVYMNLEMPLDRLGGFVARDGEALPIWIGSFLREPKQADVLRKLTVPDADERHAFIFLPGFNTAPFSVNYLLMRNDASVPTTPPDLPEPVTHAWAVSTWNSGVGFRWISDAGWASFGKCIGADGIVPV